ncbi:MAG: cyclic nucleotide-binding domain-containing protein [Spirochaetales bacterium]|nr:cyclic nucleotide-binding domain-containing protein [Spirochaetales bacterium]
MNINKNNTPQPPHSDQDNEVNELDKILFFKILEKEEKKELLALSEIINYKKGDIIISEGEIQPCIFVVIKGTVNVIVKEKSGKEVFICAIGAGDVFGEAGIFLKVKRTAKVISTENTILLKLERENMLGFIKKHKDAGIKLLMLIIFSLLRKLREANQEIAFERKSDITQEDIDSIINDFVY